MIHEIIHSRNPTTSWRRLWHAIGIGLCFLLSGCLWESGPIQLKAEPPQAFSNSGHTPLPDKWWEAFDDQDLNQLIEIALVENPSLLATWDRLKQADAVMRRERGFRFPSLNGTTNASRSRDDTGRETDRLTLGLFVAYELDLWGRVRAQVSGANFDAQASEADVATAAISLSAEIAKAWYALIEQQGQLALLDQQIATNEKILEVVTLRFRQGLAAAPDVLRQRQLIEQTRGDTKDVHAQIQTLTHQLAILLGKPPTSITFPEHSTLLQLPSLPDTGLPLELLHRRPDVQTRFFQVQAADARIAAAIADRFPRIDLTGSLSTNLSSTLAGGSFAATPAGLFSSWLATVAAQIVAPIFNAGSRAAEVDRTKAVLSESLNTYEATVLQAFREVEDALARETQQREKAVSLESQFQLATDVIAGLRGRYIQGATGYLDVLGALISQQNLARQILTARRTLIDYRVDLTKALAGSWDMNAPELRQLSSSKPKEPSKEMVSDLQTS